MTGSRDSKTRLAAVLLLFLAATAGAVDTVDLQVGPRSRILGTLRPTDERESYLVAALRGTSVRAVAKRKSDGAPNPALELLDGTGTTLATGTPTAKGSKIVGLELPSADLWRFRVTGDGILDGDFQLDLTLVPKTLWTATAATPLEPAFETTFSFAAPAGAVATVDVRTADGVFVPRIVQFSGPSGALSVVGLPQSERLHRLPGVDLPVAGEYTVAFLNDGAAPGLWKVRVKLEVPPDVRSTIDLRDEALAGDFAGLQTVFGRIASPDADTLIRGPAGTSLEDVSILVPAGALAAPALLGIAESDTFFSGDDANPAGTTISFTPSGTTFATAATITSPYDPQAFDDPATELTSVVVEDPETGEQETVAVTSVDTGTSTVSYPATHFSRFQPVSARPRSLRGSFREIELVARTTDRFGGEISLGLNSFRGLQGQRSQHGMTRDVKRFSLAWGLDAGGVPRIATNADERSVGGIVNVQTNALVDLTNGGGDFSLTRGRSPDVLGGAGPRTDGVEVYAAFRRARGVPTRGNLAGGWHGVVWEFGATTSAAGDVFLRIAGQDFELDVDPKGRAVPSANVLRTSTANLGVTPWKLVKSTQAPKPGRLDPEGAAARLTLGLGANRDVPDVVLDPVLRGEVLVGGAAFVAPDVAAPETAVLRIVVLVRRASGVRPEDVLGRSLFSAFAALPVSGGGGPARLDFTATTADLVLSPGLRFSQDGVRAALSHDGQGLPTAGTIDVARTGAFALRGDGRFDFEKPAPLGFFTPRREALLVFDAGGGAYVFGASIPARPLPASRR